MTSTNNIKNLINPNNLSYSEGHTNLCDDGKTYEFFKLESDGYVYVLCVDSNRATRYNGEGQNGKRISMDAYLTARETLESEVNIKELGGEIDPLAKAAEDPTVSVEEFCEMIENHEVTGSDLQVPAVINEHGCVDCSKCNAQNCPHRDCYRRNPYNIGGIAECPRLKIKAEEPTEEPAPKAKKTRKSKDIAYTYSENGETVVTLTAKQVDFVKHLPDTCFWENGLDSEIWVDCLCDDIGGQFAGKPMTVGAMISTLCEKGLGFRTKQRVNDHKCTSFGLTDLGKKVFAGAEWGLE